MNVLWYVNLDNFVGNVTQMQLAFQNCYSLEYMNLPKFESDKVTNIFNVFENCYSLLYLNLSHFSFKLVENFQSLFRNCVSLTSIDLSGFNTSKAIIRIIYLKIVLN